MYVYRFSSNINWVHNGQCIIRYSIINFPNASIIWTYEPIQNSTSLINACSHFDLAVNSKLDNYSHFALVDFYSTGKAEVEIVAIFQ